MRWCTVGSDARTLQVTELGRALVGHFEPSPPCPFCGGTGQRRYPVWFRYRNDPSLEDHFLSELQTCKECLGSGRNYRVDVDLLPIEFCAADFEGDDPSQWPARVSWYTGPMAIEGDFR